MHLRRNLKDRILKVFVIVLFLTVPMICISGCKKSSGNSKKIQEGQLIKTWDYLEEEIPDSSPLLEIESLPPEKAFVWGGTVSHHLLADKQINSWFYELSKRRKVENFFIICPSHYGLSSQDWSLDNCRWQTKNGIIYTNDKIEKAIAQALGVSYDSQVFPQEHGVNVLIPYIARYFQKAKVCVIALEGEPPLNQKKAQELADVLIPYFSDKKKAENFLLISTDFAHHGNYEGTVFKDNRSREFFNNPTDSTWVFCGCDNRPGIYVLSRLLSKDSKTSVLYHTNSFELSGFDEDDITSYFFSLFYD